MTPAPRFHAGELISIREAKKRAWAQRPDKTPKFPLALPLVKELYLAALEKGTPSGPVLRQWLSGSSPSLARFVHVADVLGFELKLVPKGEARPADPPGHASPDEAPGPPSPPKAA